MTRRVWGLAGSALVIATAACHRVVLSPAEIAQRVTVSPCPPGVEPASPNDSLPPGTLRVELTFEPAMPSGSEIALRLDGETTRSTIRVDPAQPIGFSLPKGVYLVRVSPAGYTGMEARVPLTAGCSATVTMRLKRDIAK